MATPIGRLGPHPYTLQDLRRCPDRTVYTDRQEPVVAVATRSGSDTAATCATTLMNVQKN